MNFDLIGSDRYFLPPVIIMYQESMKKEESTEDTVIFFSDYKPVNWIVNDEIIGKLVEDLMKFNRHKLPCYINGIKAMNKLLNI